VRSKNEKEVITQTSKNKRFRGITSIPQLLVKHQTFKI